MTVLSTGLFHVTVQAARIFRWLIDIWKNMWTLGISREGIWRTECRGLCICTSETVKSPCHHKASVGPDKRQGALLAFAQTALLAKGSK